MSNWGDDPMHSWGDDPMESWNYDECSPDKRIAGRIEKGASSSEKRLRPLTLAEVAMIGKAKGPARLMLTDMICRRRELADGSDEAARLDARIAELAVKVDHAIPPSRIGRPPSPDLPSDTVTPRPSSSSSEVRHARARVIAEFKDKGRELGIKITDEMIAKVANRNWNDRTMVTWWKRADRNSTHLHDRLIRAVFTKDPRSLWPPK